MRRMTLSIFAASIAVVLGGLTASAQAPVWTMKPSWSTATVPLFVDTESVVFSNTTWRTTDGGTAAPSARQALQMFAVGTRKEVWTQPDACPFTPTTTFHSHTSTFPSNVGGMRPFHIRRTGANQMTYMCWTPMASSGHVVSIDSRTGVITRTTAVRIKELVRSAQQPDPQSFNVLAVPAAGAYCMTSSFVVCVSGTGEVWNLANTTRPVFDEVYQYNFTLALQLDRTLELVDMRTGTVMKSISGYLPIGMKAAERYVLYVSTESSPNTAQTLDLQTMTMSAVVTLIGSEGTGYSDMGASAAAIPGAADEEPRIIVTFPTGSWSNMMGWEFPVMPTTAQSVNMKFNTDFATGGFGATLFWQTSARFTIVEVFGGYGGLVQSSILRVSNGTLTDGFTGTSSPTVLAGVEDRTNYTVVTGYDSTDINMAVTIVDLEGKAVWTKNELTVVGPDMAPIDEVSNCLMAWLPVGGVEQLACLGL